MRFTITENYTMMPNQISGVTDDGQHFYFRGDGGAWELRFGKTEDEAVMAEPRFEGEHERAGYMKSEAWESFFWEIIKEIEASE